jgi:hypothetical protein
MRLRIHRAFDGRLALRRVSAQIPFGRAALLGRRFPNLPIVFSRDTSFSEGRALWKIRRCRKPQLVYQLGVAGLDDEGEFLDSHLPAKYKNAGKNHYS